MLDAPPPILTPWLRCLMLFAVSSVVLTAILVWLAHSMFGEMRPMNGVFVVGVGLFAVLVALIVAGRYLLRAVRRVPD